MRFEFIFEPHFFCFSLDYSFFIAIFAISKNESYELRYLTNNER